MRTTANIKTTPNMKTTPNITQFVTKLDHPCWVVVLDRGMKDRQDIKQMITNKPSLIMFTDDIQSMSMNSSCGILVCVRPGMSGGGVASLLSTLGCLSQGVGPCYWLGDLQVFLCSCKSSCPCPCADLLWTCAGEPAEVSTPTNVLKVLHCPPPSRRPACGGGV